MKKTAPLLLSLFTMSVLCSSVVAYAGQTAGTSSTAVDQTQTTKTQTTKATETAKPADDAGLPVSIDRIKKALTAPESTAPPIRKEIAEGEQPRFVVQTEAPRTLTLRSYLDDGTAVPAYVRPMYDPYHTEFLEMVTPDVAKGCAQISDKGCAEMMTGRVVSGLVWQQLFSRGKDNVLRGLFKQPPQQP
jgi:hypothetical protein